MSHNVITRFPPSPTGYFHIGSARTALFNYLFAAKNDGTMYFRFEDTDKERSKKEFEADLIAGLEWLGITYTLPKVYRQSERTETYKGYLERLVAEGNAYVSKEEPTEGKGRAEVIRFKNPNTTVSFTDLVRDEVTFETKELGDFVIAKSMHEPLYHLAVVIDDHDMGVTHVIRGEDHISNTPRQILILEALHFERPQYAHIPLILAPDRSKMSKRHGAVSLNEYRSQGFIPEAIVNYLALLGWNPGGEKELFSMQELSELFDLTHVHKGGAIFDIEKLRWFNREHLRSLSDEAFTTRLESFLKESGQPSAHYLPHIASLLKERSDTFTDAAQVLQSGEFSFLEALPAVDVVLLCKGAKVDAGTVKKHLQTVSDLLSKLEGDFSVERVKNEVFTYATKEGRGAVLWPLRVALSGKEKSPDPFTIAALLGKEKTLHYIAAAIAVL